MLRCDVHFGTFNDVLQCCENGTHETTKKMLINVLSDIVVRFMRFSNDRSVFSGKDFVILAVKSQ